MKNKYIRGLALGMAAMTAFTFTTPQANLLNAQAATTATKATKGTSKITANKKSVTVTAGKTAKIKLTLNKKQKKNLKITLKSKNAKIAKPTKSSAVVKKNKKAVTVSVKGVKAGSTKVTASFKTSAGKVKKVTFTVKVNAATVALKSVKLNITSPKVGDTLKATISPSNATSVKYTWYVGDSADKVTTKITGQTKKTLVVTEDMVGKFIKVTAKGKSGTKSVTTKAAVAAKTTPDEPTPVVPTGDVVVPTGDVVETKVAVTGVTLSNTAPKVGNTVNATVEPANATNVTYEWFTLDSADAANSAATSVGTGSSLKITSAMIGKFIKVVVKGDNNSTAEAVATTAVSEDKSSSVELVDAYGLQADGTGILGDKLKITYGADFGIPAAITWYKDGAVFDTATSEEGVSNRLEKIIKASDGVGTYYAVIIDKAGKSFTSNSITITDKEDAAVIKSFTIEDDYTDGEDITYDTQDKTAVVSVTMNKNYDGKLQLWKATDTKYSSQVADDFVATSTEDAKQTAAYYTGNHDLPADNKSLLTTNAATNYQILNLDDGAQTGGALGYINNDGTVTYKWQVNSTGVERGTEYVVTFDQTSITTDNPVTGKANVSDKATAPYVNKIAKVAITKVSNGNYPEVTFYDENSNVLTWMAGKKTTFNKVGLKSANIYSVKTKTNNKNASDVVKKSITLANDNIEKGVWTTTQKAGNVDYAYWFVDVETTKGIYAKDSETITSEATPIANDSADDMDVIENKDNASTAEVSFSNLRADGTVYIVRGSFLAKNNGTTAGAETDNFSSTAKIYDKFDRNNSSTYTASAKVEKGSDKVLVDGAISKVTGYNNKTVDNANIKGGSTYDTDQYIAVFVPDNETDYGVIYTDGAAEITGFATMGNNSDKGSAKAKTGVYITSKATSFAMEDKAEGKTTGEKFKLTVKDQFGEEMTLGVDDYKYTLATADESTTPFSESADITNGAKVQVKNTGNEFTLTTTGTAKKGEVSFLRLNGTNYYLVVTNKTAGADTAAKWDIEVKEYASSPKSMTVAVKGDAVTTAALIISTLTNGNDTITFAGTDTLNTTKEIQAGDELTVDNGSDLTIKGNLKVNGTIIVNGNAKLTIDAGATISGAGTIKGQGTFTNNGTLSASVVNMTADTTFHNSGKADINDLQGYIALEGGVVSSSIINATQILVTADSQIKSDNVNATDIVVSGASLVASGKVNGTVDVKKSSSIKAEELSGTVKLEDGASAKTTSDTGFKANTEVAGGAKATIGSGSKTAVIDNKANSTPYTATADESGDATKQTQTSTAPVTTTAKEVTGITVKTAPTKTTYEEGDKFDPAGLVIGTVVSPASAETDLITYSDKTKNDFTFNPSLDTALTENNKEITIGYAGKTITQSITVTKKAASVNTPSFTVVLNNIKTENGSYTVKVENGAAVESNGKVNTGSKLVLNASPGAAYKVTAINVTSKNGASISPVSTEAAKMGKAGDFEIDTSKVSDEDVVTVSVTFTKVGFKVAKKLNPVSGSISAVISGSETDVISEDLIVESGSQVCYKITTESNVKVTSHAIVQSGSNTNVNTSAITEGEYDGWFVMPGFDVIIEAIFGAISSGN